MPIVRRSLIALATLLPTSGLFAQEAGGDAPRPTPPETRPDRPAGDRLEIRVARDGKVWFEGRVWYDPERDGADEGGIRELELRIEGLPRGEAPPRRTGGETDGPAAPTLRLRADVHTDWRDVAKVLKVWAAPGRPHPRIELLAVRPEGGSAEPPAEVPAPLPAAAADDPAEPTERLSVRIVCDEWGTETPLRPAAEPDGATAESSGGFDLRGHRVHWEVGPRRIATLEDLDRTIGRVLGDLRRAAADGAAATPVPIAIDARAGTTYRDIVQTLGVLRRAAPGAEIHFGAAGHRRR